MTEVAIRIPKFLTLFPHIDQSLDSSIKVGVVFRTIKECVELVEDGIKLCLKGFVFLLLEVVEEVIHVVEVGVVEPLSINGSVDDGDDLLNVAPVLSIEIGIGGLKLILNLLHVLILLKLVPEFADVDEL